MSLETTNEIDKVTFYEACAEGNLVVVGTYCVQKNFDIYIGDNCGINGFHLACFYGKVNVVRFFLTQVKGFDMYVRCKVGRTGLHFACYNGKLNVVQLLLKKGFDMNVRDHEGRTGFQAACLYGHLNVVQFLVHKGFDINVRNSWGCTGFHIACTGGMFNAFLKNLGFPEPNLPPLKDTNGISHTNGFPLISHDGNLNVVQFLLDNGFDMNSRCNFGNTGFHRACCHGNLKVAQFLVQEKNFDIHTGDNSGTTGFAMACIAGQFDIIWFHLHHQEFTNINDYGFQSTPLDFLIQKKVEYTDDELYIPCFLLLIESGGDVSEEHLIHDDLISEIQNRIFEITSMKKIIYKKWTGRIAKLITDFTMEPFMDMSLQNLSQFLDQNVKEHNPQEQLIILQLINSPREYNFYISLSDFWKALFLAITICLLLYLFLSL